MPPESPVRTLTRPLLLPWYSSERTTSSAGRSALGPLIVCRSGRPRVAGFRSWRSSATTAPSAHPLAPTWMPLTQHWAPLFSTESAVFLASMRAFLAHAEPSVAHTPMLSYKDLAATLDHVPHSAPGPDGLS